MDYGNSQTVPLSFLTELSRFECQLPAQAMECYLTSVRPSAISAAEETWAEEANARLEELVTDKRLVATVRRGGGEEGGGGRGEGGGGRGEGGRGGGGGGGGLEDVVPPYYW